MKVLIATDKFKGSLDAEQVCSAVEHGLIKKHKDIECVKIPMADGGEGSLAVISKKMQFYPVKTQVLDPLFRPVEAVYYIHRHAAYIEMASASGLQLLNDQERNCMLTTTYGTGQLVKDAITREIDQIFLFIGGSATNDAGTGLASALGYHFYDKNGNELKPIGKNLLKISDYAPPEKLHLPVINVISDVSNPFFGPNGAAYVYARQKGANNQEVLSLDEGLKNIRGIIKNKSGIDVQSIAGSGAAGGLGGGCVAFLNAKLLPGIDTIMKLVGFEAALEACDLVITGEGKFDHQTLQGKVISGIAKTAKKNNKKVYVICGLSEVEENEFKSMGIDKVIALVDDKTTKDEAMRNAEALIVLKIMNLDFHSIIHNHK